MASNNANHSPDSSTGSDFERSLRFGAAEDRLNYKKLGFWTVLGTAIVTFVVVVLINVYDLTITTSTQKAKEQSQFYGIQELRQKEQTVLGSYGIVDLQKGIYRVPIDSAIQMLVDDAK